ncbi:hypothetical protein [Maritalea sp.]|uniref:hypothetical protein n=1 Tax=Maritalea sp. TaxID=2003361 RepID=UPI003EF12CD4
MSRDISEANSDNSIESYLDKLFRLIPTEVTAAFLAINTLLGTDNNSVNIYLSLLSAFVLACLSPLLLQRFAGVRSKIQLVSSPITFLIWAGNIAIYRFNPAWSPDKVLPTILILWTVLLLFATTWSDGRD